MMPACLDEDGTYRVQHEMRAGRCRWCNRAVIEPRLPRVEQAQSARRYDPLPPRVRVVRDLPRFDGEGA